MPKAKRTKEEILKDLEENPPEVKIGHPLGDLSGNSLDDDKRMDEKGNVVVDGQLWSQSHTGLWLSLLGTRGGLAPIGVISIAEEMTTVGGLNVALVTTFGKPQWTTETIGQAIEIPSDLGQDPSKREYMTAWILRTMLEIFTLSAAENWFRGIPAGGEDGFALWLTTAAEGVIRRTGL
jgi:hypothetical protein